MISAVLTTPPSVWTVTLDDGSTRDVDPGPLANTEAGAIAVLATEAAAVEAARGSEMALLVRFLDNQAEWVIGPIPQAERLTWDAKEAAAHAYLETPSEEQLALLQSEAALTGESLASLVGVILVRAAVFRAVGSRIAGTRRRAASDMAAAHTIEAVIAIREAAEADFAGWLAVLMNPPEETE